MTGRVPPKIHGADAQRRTRLREDGFKHGYSGMEKRSTEKEYLTSYRRGQEAAGRTTA